MGELMNPRYLAYCKMMGKTPDEMLVHDAIEWPGGIMTGFMLWIQGKWWEWDGLNNHPSREPHGEAQHKAFDLWLNNQ